MNLDELRKEIDRCDNQILTGIVDRLNLMQNVADYKFKNNLPVEDLPREEALIKKLTEKLKELGYDDPALVRSIYELLIKKAKIIQFERFDELENES